MGEFSSKMKVKLRNKFYKTIVFDLNGTITGRVSDHPEHIKFRDSYITSYLPTFDVTNLPSSTTSALQKAGLDVKKYYAYRNSNINWNLFHTYSKEVSLFLKELDNLGFTLVLYTDCYANQVAETLQIMKCTDVFSIIVSSENGFKKPSKNAYLWVAEQVNEPVENLLVVANDWNNDLEPIDTLGGNTIWIESEKQLLDTRLSILENSFPTKLNC